MKFRLFSVRDNKSGLFLAPFPARSDVDAIRNIESSAVQMRDTPIASHPEDFDLRCLGTFDDETGLLAPQTPVVVLEFSTLSAFKSH